MPPDVVLVTDRGAYRSGEVVSIDLHNRTGRPVFVLAGAGESLYTIHRLGASSDEPWTPLDLRDDPHAHLNEDRPPPQPMAFPVGITRLGTWDGRARSDAKEGKRPVTGRFVAAIPGGYAFETLLEGAVLRSPRESIVSDPFEIRG